MKGFVGFPEGKLKVVPVPELFFSDLLVIIDDLVELKVTLYCLWLLHRKQGDMRHVSSVELEADELLISGLLPSDLGGREVTRPERESACNALREGLERAVARGTLLQVTAQRPNHPEEKWYFLNSERGRAAVAGIERGEWVPEDDAGAIRLQARRPNIFNLYEQNLGLIQSSLLAEELMDAERTYPAEWIEDAFRIAVANNVRRWVYVRRILERWAKEGRGEGHARLRGDDTRAERRRYIEGKYADFIEH